LVEDYEPLRNDMAEMLEDFFAVVHVASNGKEALDTYQKYFEEHKKYFDIVITDIEMPIMDGIELCELLYKIEKKQQIIVLSAYTEREYLLSLINLGVAKFIIKPVKYEELMDALNTISQELQPLEKQKIDKHSELIYLDETHIWNQELGLLFHNEVIVELTKHELELLQFFIERKNQISTNLDIVEMFYLDNIDIQENSIRNLVFKLRKKLPSKAIKSIYGMGYMFTIST